MTIIFYDCSTQSLTMTSKLNLFETSSNSQNLSVSVWFFSFSTVSQIWAIASRNPFTIRFIKCVHIIPDQSQRHCVTPIGCNDLSRKQKTKIPRTIKNTLQYCEQCQISQRWRLYINKLTTTVTDSYNHSVLITTIII